MHLRGDSSQHTPRITAHPISLHSSASTRSFLFCPHPPCLIRLPRRFPFVVVSVVSVCRFPCYSVYGTEVHSHAKRNCVEHWHSKEGSASWFATRCIRVPWQTRLRFRWHCSWQASVVIQSQGITQNKTLISGHCQRMHLSASCKPTPFEPVCLRVCVSECVLRLRTRARTYAGVMAHYTHICKCVKIVVTQDDTIRVVIKFYVSDCSWSNWSF